MVFPSSTAQRSPAGALHEGRRAKKRGRLGSEQPCCCAVAAGGGCTKRERAEPHDPVWRWIGIFDRPHSRETQGPDRNNTQAGWRQRPAFVAAVGKVGRLTCRSQRALQSSPFAALLRAAFLVTSSRRPSRNLSASSDDNCGWRGQVVHCVGLSCPSMPQGWMDVPETSTERREGGQQVLGLLTQDFHHITAARVSASKEGAQGRPPLTGIRCSGQPKRWSREPHSQQALSIARHWSCAPSRLEGFAAGQSGADGVELRPAQDPPSTGDPGWAARQQRSTAHRISHHPSRARVATNLLLLPSLSSPVFCVLSPRFPLSLTPLYT